jgi:hypothetical protein
LFEELTKKQNMVSQTSFSLKIVVCLLCGSLLHASNPQVASSAPIVAPSPGTTLAPTGAPTTAPTNAPTTTPLCRVQGFAVVGNASKLVIKNGDRFCVQDILDFAALADSCVDSVRIRLKNAQKKVVRAVNDLQAPYTLDLEKLAPSRNYTLTAIPDGKRILGESVWFVVSRCKWAQP